MDEGKKPNPLGKWVIILGGAALVYSVGYSKGQSDASLGAAWTALDAASIANQDETATTDYSAATEPATADETEVAASDAPTDDATDDSDTSSSQGYYQTASEDPGAAAEAAANDAAQAAEAASRGSYAQPVPVAYATPTRYQAATYASATLPSVAAALPTPTYAPQVGCAENGSCYGDISTATGLPKTVAVHGYYRRDGTYVRGYYRSHR